MSMLQFDFTSAHRPKRMMPEVDLCSRYEAFAKHFKTKDTTKETQELVVVAMALLPTNMANQTIREVGTHDAFGPGSEHILIHMGN